MNRLIHVVKWMEGNMYKEIIVRKKLHGILGWFLLLNITICISDLVKRLYKDSTFNFYSSIFFIIVLGIISYMQFIKYNENFKFTIIADQLTIHKVRNWNGVEGKLLENIKIKNICLIEKVSSLKEKYSVISTKRYCSTMFGKDVYCCVYKDGDKLRRFYFQPSEVFVNKIKCYMEKLSA